MADAWGEKNLLESPFRGFLIVQGAMFDRFYMCKTWWSLFPTSGEALLEVLTLVSSIYVLMANKQEWNHCGGNIANSGSRGSHDPRYMYL